MKINTQLFLKNTQLFLKNTQCNFIFLNESFVEKSSETLKISEVVDSYEKGKDIITGANGINSEEVVQRKKDSKEANNELNSLMVNTDKEANLLIVDTNKIINTIDGIEFIGSPQIDLNKAVEALDNINQDEKNEFYEWLIFDFKSLKDQKTISQKNLDLIIFKEKIPPILGVFLINVDIGLTKLLQNNPGRLSKDNFNFKDKYGWAQEISNGAKEGTPKNLFAKFFGKS